jgi:hypothetical protein
MAARTSPATATPQTTYSRTPHIAGVLSPNHLFSRSALPNLPVPPPISKRKGVSPGSDLRGSFAAPWPPSSRAHRGFIPLEYDPSWRRPAGE